MLGGCGLLPKRQPTIGPDTYCKLYMPVRMADPSWDAFEQVDDVAYDTARYNNYVYINKCTELVDK